MNVRIKDMAYMSIFTALIAIGAFIKIPVPVCPFTLQLLFTTLAGLILGPKKGAISVLCYIIIGLIGVPVFVSGGGLFCLGTFVTGKIASSEKYPSLKRLLIANFSCLIIVYSLGILYYFLIMTYYVGTGIGIWTLFLYCFLLAIPGDIILCILAAILGKKVVPLLKRSGITINA